jgi:hypothetical protein
MLRLQIFVSSPGDVGAERGVALAVAERLQLEFRGRIELETYLWERSVLRVTDSFQAQILDIQEAGLAVFILWAQMGTPLSREQFSRNDGSSYRSGTEYEFERALAGYEERKSPTILCYLKTAEVRLSLKNREGRDRQIAELDAVNHFVDKWFRNDDGSFKSAFYNFDTTAHFEEILEIHLRDWILQQLQSAEPGAAAETQWQGSPFRGLQGFEFEHAMIYYGRTALVSELLDALRQRGGAGRGFFMVVGMSGVGKSSLVKAGVLPILMRPRVIENVIAWRRASFKPNVGDRSLLTSFASSLVEQDALPELVRSVGNLEALMHDPPALVVALTKTLDSATEQARDKSPNLHAGSAVKLIVVCDQFEEVFDETVTDRDRAEFCEVIRAMTLTGRVWVICVLRADFYSRCAELPAAFLDLFIERGGIFTVAGPRSSEIAQMIRRPATLAGLKFERRGDPEEGLDEVLRDAASGNPTVLPLLEFTLDELWRRSKGKGILRFADYEAIGGLQGALKIRADEEFARLPPKVQASLPKVLAALVHTDPTDERLILQNRAALAQFGDLRDCKALIDAFVSARLFVADRGSDGAPIISLAHEALLREWPPAVQWIEQNRDSLRLRAGIASAAALWRNSEQSDSRLLVGALLKDAARLLATNREMLAPEERRFVELSAAESQRSLRRTIRRSALAAAIVGLAITIPIIGLPALTYGIGYARTVPVVWNSGDQIPVSTRVSANLASSIRNLTPFLSVQIADMGKRPELNAWAVAQMWVALKGLDPALAGNGTRLRAFMNSARDQICQCWREAADKLPHTLTTAWVIYALASYDQPATPGELEHVLNRQAGNGWWAMFPATPDEKNASTTATAWTMLALNEQIKHKLIGDNQISDVTAAIRKALVWLAHQAEPGTARWNEYPPDQIFERHEYLAASALVVHVLDSIDSSTKFDALWLDELPHRVPGLLENEISKGVVLLSKTEFTLDEVRNYPFPSMLRATAEAYAQGNILERTSGLRWIDEALKTPFFPGDFHSEYWTMAETLFALRQTRALLDAKRSKLP